MDTWASLKLLNTDKMGNLKYGATDIGGAGPINQDAANVQVDPTLISQSSATGLQAMLNDLSTAIGAGGGGGSGSFKTFTDTLAVNDKGIDSDPVITSGKLVLFKVINTPVNGPEDITIIFNYGDEPADI